MNENPKRTRKELEDQIASLKSEILTDDEYNRQSQVYENDTRHSIWGDYVAMQSLLYSQIELEDRVKKLTEELAGL